HPHLEVEVDARARTRTPGPADELAFRDPIATLDERLREVRVHRHDPVGVAELDDEPVALVAPQPPHPDHLTRARRVDLRVRPALDVDAVVDTSPPGPERGTEVSVQRNEEQLLVWDPLERVGVPGLRRRSENSRDENHRGRSAGDHWAGV